MESLIELVASSLARHGIECPDGHSQKWVTAPVKAAVEPSVPTALPEHNYRKILDGDPAP